MPWRRTAGTYGDAPMTAIDDEATGRAEVGERLSLRRDRSFALIVGVGALLRVVYYATKRTDPLLFNDSLYYSGQARQLAHGIWFKELFSDHPGAEHGPLTSILMAPLSHADDPVRWQRLVTLATGIVFVWVIGVFAAEAAGRSVGLCAAAIAAVYPNLWLNDGLVMSESISTLAIAFALWAAWRAGRSPGWRPLVLTGVALGLASLARSELILLVPLVLAWVLVVRVRSGWDWRPILVAVGACGLVLAPWVIFNLARFERPVLLTTNDGTTLLGSNCDDMYHGGNAGGWLITCVTSAPGYDPLEEPSVRSARLRSQAVTYVGDHLDDVPKVMAVRLARTLDLYGLDDVIAQDVGEERPRWAVWAGIAMFWALVPLAVIGAVRLRPKPRWLLLAPVAVALATSIMFYGGHRIRSSAEPSLVVFAAVTVAAILANFGAGRRLSRP